MDPFFPVKVEGIPGPYASLFVSGLAILAIQALYYTMYWMLGGREGKMKALDGFERTVVSGVLMGIAFAMPYYISLGVSNFAALANINGTAVSLLKDSTTLDKYLVNLNKALGYAQDVYKQYLENAESSMSTFFWTTVGSGLIPFTQPLSMAVINVFMAPISALSTLAMSSAMYMVVTGIAMSWQWLIPVGAVLVAHERTRNFGALLVAVGAVVPPVLAVGADVLTNAVSPSSIQLGLWDYLTGNVGKLDDIVKAVFLMGTMGALTGGLVYAVSRIFDYVGASLSFE